MRDITRKGVVMKSLKQLGALALVSLPALSMAAVDAGVTTALSDAKTDVSTVGLAVFVVAVAIIIFKWFRRAL